MILVVGVVTVLLLWIGAPWIALAIWLIVATVHLMQEREQ